MEACDWYSNLDDAYPAPPAWADVVLDYRINREAHRHRPLPDDLGSPTLVWASQMPGWTLEGFTVRGETRHTQVLRFTDPDGFRGALVVSGKEGTDADHVQGRFAAWGFETGRFTRLFPTADVDLLSALTPAPGSMRSPHAPPEFAPLRAPDEAPVSSAEPAVSAARSYHLLVLRDALRDPARWFGLDPEATTGAQWQHLTCGPSPARETAQRGDEGTAAQFPDAMGPDCPVSPDRVMLAYAMAGYTSYAPVARFVAAGLDAAELGRWREGDTGKGRPGRHFMNDEEILDWFAVVGGGGKARRHAIAFFSAGVSPAKARQWKVLGDTPSAYADRIAGYEEFGWTPHDVRRMATTLAEVPLDGYLRNGAFKAVAEWMFAPVDAALDFHACGYTAAQARTLCEEADDVNTVYASVAAMAMLRRPLAGAAPAW